MEIGKIPENVLKRSVFKQLNCKRNEVIVHPGVGEDCAVLSVAERFFCFLSNRIAFFVISYGFNFSLMIFNNPVSKWFCAVFVIYILTSQRLTIKEKFNTFCISISLHINQLAFVPVPVRKKMYKREWITYSTKITSLFEGGITHE